MIHKKYKTTQIIASNSSTIIQLATIQSSNPFSNQNQFVVLKSVPINMAFRLEN